MKKSHSGLWSGIAVLFIAAIYSAILFLVKPVFDAAAWVLYGSTMVAFLLTAVQMSSTSRTSSAIVMGSVLGIITAIYFGLQLLFGGIICMSFIDVPVTPVVICEIILLAAYLGITFFMYAVQSNSAAQDHDAQDAVYKMRSLENDIRTLMDEQNDPTVKQALKSLAEDIHYGNVTSLPGLADVEDRIVRNVATLRAELKDENADPIARIETLRRLIK